MKRNTLPQLFITLTFLFIFSSGCKKENTKQAPVKVTIGQTYQGGIVAYILKPSDIGYDSTTDHGLIVAPSDQGTAQWYNGTYVLTQADNQGIGGGKSNTALIVASQGNFGCAASLCDTLSIGGNKGWYLPDLNELTVVMQNVGTTAGFSGYIYWTSNEESDSVADGQNLSQAAINGSWICPKTAAHPVRAIRSF